jgi:hypothetical protein
MAQRAIITPTTEPELIAQPEAPVCRHHWVIQPAEGPISTGMCQVCEEVREFKNYVESATWGDSRLTNRASGARAAAETDDVEVQPEVAAQAKADAGPEAEDSEEEIEEESEE